MEDYRFLTGKVLPLPPEADLPEYHTQWCFGCGPDNEHSLGLRFRVEGDKVVSELDFAPWFQGGPGVVHGGATAAFFDDLMGTVLMAHLRPAVTAKLEANYLLPIPLGVTIRGEAWLAEAEGRKLWVEAAGTDERGNRYLEARALFIPVDIEHWSKAVSELSPEARERLTRYQEGSYYP